MVAVLILTVVIMAITAVVCAIVGTIGFNSGLI